MKYDTCQDKEGEVKGVEVVYEVKEAGMLKSSLSANAGTQTSDAVSHLKVYLDQLIFVQCSNMNYSPYIFHCS